MPKIHDFYGFWTPKWSTKPPEFLWRDHFLATHGPNYRKEGSQTSFFMFFNIFLDAFGAYFEGFGLDFGAFNLQKMPKIC